MSGTWNSDLQVPKPSPYRLSYCRPNKHCFRGCMCLQRDWGIFPENNGCLECLAPLTAHTVPYRKWLMCREEVRAATISSTASCREERRTGRIEVQMIKELRVETWMWDFDSVCLLVYSLQVHIDRHSCFSVDFCFFGLLLEDRGKRVFQSMMSQLWSRFQVLHPQIKSVFLLFPVIFCISDYSHQYEAAESSWVIWI